MINSRKKIKITQNSTTQKQTLLNWKASYQMPGLQTYTYICLILCQWYHIIHVVQTRTTPVNYRFACSFWMTVLHSSVGCTVSYLANPLRMDSNVILNNTLMNILVLDESFQLSPSDKFPQVVISGKAVPFNPVLRKNSRGLPGGAVVENLPANAGNTGSSPGLGRSHMPRSN